MNNSFHRISICIVCAFLVMTTIIGCHDIQPSRGRAQVENHVLGTEEVIRFFQEQFRYSRGIAFVSTNKVPAHVSRMYVAFMNSGLLVQGLETHDSASKYGWYTFTTNGGVHITMNPKYGRPYTVKFSRNGDELFMLNGRKYGSAVDMDEIYCDGVYKLEGDALVTRFWEEHE